MRRAHALLCLIVILLVPGVSQAEAAESLARSIAERADRAVLESPEMAGNAAFGFCALKAAPTASLATPESCQSGDLHLRWNSSVVDRSDGASLSSCRLLAIGRRWAPAGERQAWLQQFRF